MKKKILCMMCESWNKTQIELQDGYLMFVENLTKNKNNDVTFLFCSTVQKKKYFNRVSKMDCKIIECLVNRPKDRHDIWDFKINKKQISGFDKIYIYGFSTAISSQQAYKYYSQYFLAKRKFPILFAALLLPFHLLYIMFNVLEQNKNAKIVYQMIDMREPWECFYKINNNIIIKGQYKIDDKRIKDTKFFERILFMKGQISLEKTFDLVFGYFCNKQQRRELDEYCSKIPKGDPRIIIYCKDRLRGKKNYVDQKVYYDMLKHSKFTLVAAALNNKYFSNIRFLESITHGCIPILFRDSKYESYFKTRPGLLDFFEKNNLIIDYKCDIIKKIKELNKRYEELQQQFYRLDAIKKMARDAERIKEVLENNGICKH